MPTPVIIAAYNEAERIGSTLDALDNKTCGPIVVANGCDDETAAIARGYGVHVIERAEQGKLLAIQEALHCLGARALGPVLFLDADSQPRFPRLWAKTMQGNIDPDTAHVRAGSLSYTGGSVIDDLGWTAKAQRDAYMAVRSGTPRFCGANMLTQFHNERILGKILELPHIWLGEDHAIGLEVAENGGAMDQLVDIRANVKTSARYLPSIAHVLSVGSEEAKKEIGRRYKERAAPGSMSFRAYARRKKRLQKV